MRNILCTEDELKVGNEIIINRNIYLILEFIKSILYSFLMVEAVGGSTSNNIDNNF
jgi:hypothetical protein